MYLMASWHGSAFCVADPKSLQWRHNGRNGVSNHQPHDCLLNRLFRRRSEKISKRHVTGLRVGNSSETSHKWPVTWKMFPFDDVIMDGNPSVSGRFPSQRASNSGFCVFFLNQSKQTPEQIVGLPVICDAMTLMWRLCNDQGLYSLRGHRLMSYWYKASPYKPETFVRPFWIYDRDSHTRKTSFMDRGTGFNIFLRMNSSSDLETQANSWKWLVKMSWLSLQGRAMILIRSDYH